jgi:hypothetical protein
MALTDIDGQRLGDSVADKLGDRNLIINGAMMVDQRNSGASASPTGTYGFQLDRYAVWYSTGSGHTVQQVEDAPTGFQYSWKFTTGTGATPTGSDYGRLYYSVEGYDANVLELGTANQQAFTFSFYVKISVAGTYGVQFTDSLVTTKYQTSFDIAAGEVGTWVRRVITVPAGTIVNGTYSTSNGLSFAIAFDLGEGPTRSVAAGYQTGASSGALGLTGGTKIMATSGATYQLTGIQLELGNTATPFQHRSYADELQRCQRYYYKHQATAVGVIFGTGWCDGTTQAKILINFPVEMRDAPASFDQSGTAGDYSVTNTGNVACNAVVQQSTFGKLTGLVNAPTGGSLITNDSCALRAANTNAFLAFSAEL